MHGWLRNHGSLLQNASRCRLHLSVRVPRDDSSFRSDRPNLPRSPQAIPGSPPVNRRPTTDRALPTAFIGTTSGLHKCAPPPSPCVGWLTWPELKFPKSLCLYQHVRAVCTHRRANISSEMESSRRVDSPSISWNYLTPKTRGEKYTSVWRFWWHFGSICIRKSMFWTKKLSKDLIPIDIPWFRSWK